MPSRHRPASHSRDPSRYRKYGLVWRTPEASTVSAIIASPAGASSAATAQPNSAWAQANQNSLPRSMARAHTGSTAARTVAGRSASWSDIAAVAATRQRV